jgi:hypothetical protein
MFRATQLFLPSLLLLALVACSDDDSDADAEPTPSPGATPASFIETFIDAPYSEGTPEGIFPFYNEPQPTASYVDPAGEFAFETMLAASSSDPDVVAAAGGVEIRPLGGELTPNEADCPIAQVVQVQMLYFTYLPPDTEVDGPPYQMQCEDGTVIFGGQNFDREEGYVSVRYELDAPIYRGLELATGIEEVTFDGRVGLLVDNPNPGVRDSSARALTAIPSGYIFIQGGGLTAEETLRILAGIECPDCQ